MLFDNKKVLKAKQYQYVEIDKINHLIKPVGTETEVLEINPQQLVIDFTDLIREYSTCNYLRVWQIPQSYVGESTKEGQNRIAYINTRIYKEQEQMQKALMAFINKYGLFGLLNDEAAGYDYYQLQEDGSYNLMQYPVCAIVPDSDNLSFSVVPYDEYIRKYFPDVPVDEAIKLKGAARTCHYAEYMEDILQNKRILACADYIASIDKGNSSPLIIQGMNASLCFKKEVPVYDIQYRTLIEFCHSIFFLNAINIDKNTKGIDQESKETVRICQYRRCHRPFIGNRMYCSDECMHNANKARKKGDQNNG